MKKSTAWDIAQKEIDSLPPYLADDELTVKRFYDANKNQIGENEAREILNRFVEAGMMTKEERRKRNKGGGRVDAYILVEKGSK